MDDLLQQYRQRIDALAISEENKKHIFDNFISEIQFKLVNSFFDTLTDKQKKDIAEASTDEEAMKIYFDLMNQSIEIPEFLQFIEQIYTEAMTKALSELPSPTATSQ